MSSEQPWDGVLEDWVAAERERLGGPPTAEEVMAFREGRLSAEDAARVRALLVYYPELTSLLGEEEPMDRTTLRNLLPLGTMVLLVAMLGVAIHFRQTSLEPYVHQARHEIQAWDARGPASPIHDLPPGEERYLLALRLAQSPSYPHYRLDIVDLSEKEPKLVWSGTNLRPVNGTFELSATLDPGLYRIDVYGLQDARAHALEHFRVRVPRGP